MNILELPYDTTGLWERQWYCFFAEETFDPGDDAPGTITDPVRFNNLKRYLSDGSRSFIETLNLNQPQQDRYFVSNLEDVPGDNGWRFDVWTNPL